jgi:hypothetical protein
MHFRFSRIDETFVGSEPGTMMMMTRFIRDEVGNDIPVVAAIGTRQQLADAIERDAMFAGVTDEEFCEAFDALAKGEALPGEPDLTGPDLSWIDFLPEVGKPVTDYAVEIVQMRQKARAMEAKARAMEAKARCDQEDLVSKIRRGWTVTEIKRALDIAREAKEAA